MRNDPHFRRFPEQSAHPRPQHLQNQPAYSTLPMAADSQKFFVNKLLLWNRNRPVCASHSSTALQLAENALGSKAGLVTSIDRPKCAHLTLYLFQDHCLSRFLADIRLTKRKMTNPVMTAAVASANGSTTAAPVLGSASFRAFQSSLLDSTA